MDNLHDVDNNKAVKAKSKLSDSIKGVIARNDPRVIKSVLDTRYGRRIRVQVDCSKDGLTEQSHKKACDINTIIERYEKTGLAPVTTRQALYGDVSGVEDYLTSMNKLISAQEKFDSLPSKVRAKFNNDPARFIEFCSDEKNIDEMIDLGLLARVESKKDTAGEKPPVSKKDADSAGEAQ